MSWRPRDSRRVMAHRRPGIHAATLMTLAGVAALVMPAAMARADHIYTEPVFGSRGYTAMEELSYETIVEPGKDYGARLRLRVALHNTSAESQDFVEHLALPVTAELEGLRVARNGTWVDHAPTDVHARPVSRDVPGSVYARVVPASRPGTPPSAEILGFGIDAGATIQVELILSVQPRLRADRWQLDLPRRGGQNVLAGDRRSMVKGLGNDEGFWVDGISNDGGPYIVTRPGDAVTVAWPAHVDGRAALDGRYEITPDAFGDGGRFRVYLRLGESRPLSPDHITVLVDRSKSTTSRLQGDTRALVDHIFDQRPADTTFDALSFARHVTPLLEDDDDEVRLPRIDDPGARGEIARALDTNDRAQGTNLPAALLEAAARLEGSRARDPLLLVVTDGMLPSSFDADALQRDLARAAGRKRPPDILFVVDDPILAQRGLSPDHPAARTAAALGARLSLQALANLQPSLGTDILAAPRVLGDLDLALPASAELDEALPGGLVAGNFVVIEGSYEKRPPSSVLVRGTMGKRRVARRLKAHRPPARPEALASATAAEASATAAQEGFAFPSWYTRYMTESAKAKIARSGGTDFNPQGELSGDIFHWYLRRRVLPRAKVCYNQALGRNQLQGGEITLEMEVGKGEVMFARVAESELEAPDEQLLECMDAAAWALEIPAANLDERIYTLRYPLKFAPPEGGKAPGRGDGNDPFVDMMVDQADILAR